MYKLGYVMMTYNRPLIVEDYIKTAKDYFDEMGILLTIADGSDNDETAKIVTKYKCDCIKYYHLKNPGFGERLFKGIDLSNAEYICITGDSQLPLIDNLYRVFELMDNNYDLINLSYRDNKKIKNKDYDNIVDMCRDNCWDMTLFGSVFFKKSSYKLMPVHELDNNLNSMLIYNVFYFNNFKGDKFSGHYEALPVISISKLKNEASYNVFDVFTKDWYDTVQKFDSKYDAYKGDIIFDHSKYSSLKLYKPKMFLKYRAVNKYNIDFLKKNKEVLLTVTRISFWKLYLVACVPSFLCKILYCSYKKIRGIKNA